MNVLEILRKIFDNYYIAVFLFFAYFFCMKGNKTTDLLRFLKKQGEYFEIALGEICSGRKQTHWMWFIFPQIDGLSYSPTSIRYALRSFEEAQAYYDNPLLRQNLLEITTAVLNLPCRDPKEIFSYPDYLKLQSSMTLFEQVSLKSSHATSVFSLVLDKLYEGERDQKTIELINRKSRLN